MKTIYKILVGMIFIVEANRVCAQDIHFSQFYEMPLYRNPALAGIVNGDIRVQAVFRSQWNSVANAYKTGALTAEYKMHAGKGSDYVTAGFEAFYDRAGSAALTTTIFMPVINYHKSISAERNMYLSAAFMGGFVDRRLDRSKIITNNQFDNGTDGETLAKARYTYWDGSAGISFNSELGNNPENNIVIGAALQHFNTPRDAFYENVNIHLEPKWVFSADVKTALTEASSLTIHSDFSKQGTYSEIIGGVLYGIKIGPQWDNPDYSVSGGFFFRVNDALIPVIKLEYHPFSFAFSYDINISKLRVSSYGQGGFELSLSYIGFLDRDNSSLKAFHCPRF